MTATRATVSHLERGIALIKVDGPLLGSEEIPAFKDALAACIAERPPGFSSTLAG